MPITCSHDDCQENARWRPVLVLRRDPSAEGQELCFEQLGYCDAHHDSLAIDAFLSDEGGKKIARTLREAGRGRIDLRHTTLAWARLSRVDLARLSRVQHHTTTPPTSDTNYVDSDSDLAF